MEPRHQKSQTSHDQTDGSAHLAKGKPQPRHDLQRTAQKRQKIVGIQAVAPNVCKSLCIANRAIQHQRKAQKLSHAVQKSVGELPGQQRRANGLKQTQNVFQIAHVHLAAKVKIGRKRRVCPASAAGVRADGVDFIKPRQTASRIVGSVANPFQRLFLGVQVFCRLFGAGKALARQHGEKLRQNRNDPRQGVCDPRERRQQQIDQRLHQRQHCAFEPCKGGRSLVIAFDRQHQNVPQLTERSGNDGKNKHLPCKSFDPVGKSVHVALHLIGNGGKAAVLLFQRRHLFLCVGIDAFLFPQLLVDAVDCLFVFVNFGIDLFHLGFQCGDFCQQLAFPLTGGSVAALPLEIFGLGSLPQSADLSLQPFGLLYQQAFSALLFRKLFPQLVDFPLYLMQFFDSGLFIRVYLDNDRTVCHSFTCLLLDAPLCQQLLVTGGVLGFQLHHCPVAVEPFPLFLVQLFALCQLVPDAYHLRKQTVRPDLVKIGKKRPPVQIGNSPNLAPRHPVNGCDDVLKVFFPVHQAVGALGYRLTVIVIDKGKALFQRFAPIFRRHGLKAGIKNIQRHKSLFLVGQFGIRKGGANFQHRPII